MIGAVFSGHVGGTKMMRRWWVVTVWYQGAECRGSGGSGLFKKDGNGCGKYIF